ncbi:MAG: S8 family serine peptidase [Bdellovibrionales bacterium]|nr:S8 family serine peptidase [Bdellovibrionales bacterium]
MAIRILFLVTIFTPLLVHAADLSRLSWGMENTGKEQIFLIDHYTSGVIEGVPGEDIHPISELPLRRTPVVVAVLDTGVDESHPVLEGALARPGFNAIDGTTNVKDNHGHGTHVAGIIAGRTSAGGFSGVSSSALILPIRVIQSGPNAPIRPQGLTERSGTALTENVAKGIMHAISRRAEIIHLSLAWPASIRSKSVDEAMEFARKKGIIVVASAGNDSTQALVYPCLYSNVVCVGAHGPDGAFTHFSNYGPMVDLLAPGISILSSWPLAKAPMTFAGQNGYEFRNGTSMAAPFVSGALAELLSLGIPPGEAVNRILLSARATKKESRFRSEVIGIPPQGPEPVQKESRFGNLDLGLAYRMKPAPLILPESKAPLVIEWDGNAISKKITVPWINRWADARDVSIRIQNRAFHFDLVRTGERFEVSLDYPIKFSSESFVSIPAEVRIAGQETRVFSIPITLSRVIHERSIPEFATVHTFPDFNPDRSMSIRSVIPVAPLTTQSHLFLKDGPEGLTVYLLAENRSLRKTILRDLESGRLLNWYGLPDESFQAIFATQTSPQERPSFLLVFFDAGLRIQEQIRIGTETTVFPENFRFVRTEGRYLPHFISHGLTPKPDLPPFDPWNPDFKDEKRPRLYRLGKEGLRIIPFEKDETPLLFLKDDIVLTSKGSGYLQNYRIHRIADGRILESNPLELPNYRLLAGLIETRSSVPLDETRNPCTYLSGRSTPGSLRVSSIACPRSSDLVLGRPSPLDSLMSVLGVYTARGGISFFTESHFDLIFHPADRGRPFATSLNRYSYIPSMVFSKNFFPISARKNAGQSLAGVYLPANLANDFISEVLVADTETRRILHPVGLRLKATGNCKAVGNLALEEDKTDYRMIFWCGNNRIEIPVTIPE